MSQLTNFRNFLPQTVFKFSEIWVGFRILDPDKPIPDLGVNKAPGLDPQNSYKIVSWSQFTGPINLNKVQCRIGDPL